MRLWSLHPKYLDTKGIVALWREALLAQAVLRGDTKGYRHHPQLARFKAAHKPLHAITAYLSAIHKEAVRRNFKFDASKIGPGQDAEMYCFASPSTKCDAFRTHDDLSMQRTRLPFCSRHG